AEPFWLAGILVCYELYVVDGSVLLKDRPQGLFGRAETEITHVDVHQSSLGRMLPTGPAATAAAAAVCFRAGFVHGERPAVDLLTVYGGDRSLRFGVVAHLDETESLGAAGVTIGNQGDAF